MKTVIFFALLGISLTARCQDNKVPEKVDSAFKTKYPETKVDDWSLENSYYSFEFYKRGSMFTAVFNKDGVWIETAEVISDMSLPASLQAYIKKNYPSGSISYCEDVETHDSTHFLRVNLVSNLKAVVIRSDRDGNNISVVNPGG